MSRCCCQHKVAVVAIGTDPRPVTPPPPPPPPRNDVLISLFPGANQLGILWGEKVVSLIDYHQPELISRATQTEESKATQTEPQSVEPVRVRVEEPNTELRKTGSSLARFKGSSHGMNIVKRDRRNMPVHQVRVLHLHKGENKENTLFRLEQGWVLRFLLGPSLHSVTVRLFCNHPTSSKTPFDRTGYQELEWKCPTGMRSDLTDVYAEVNMIMSGSFNYYFTIDESVCQAKGNGMGFFLVDPILKVGPDEQDITMDCLQIQSVITKLLGPFDQWERRLQVSHESGYNMIHFTPVQELGISNSAYSIRDQLVLSPAYSAGSGSPYTMNDLEALVRKMDKNWRVLSLTDLVFNHTAKDSPWIYEHPDSVYNLENSPHLRPAYIVDRIFHHFNIEVTDGKWSSRGIPCCFCDEGHLQALRHVLSTEVFPKYQLHEFFTCNVDNIIKEFKQAIEEKRSFSDKKGDVKIIQDPRYRRLQSTIDLDVALSNFNIDRIGNEDDRPNAYNRQDRIKKCCDALLGRLTQLNAEKEWEMNGHISTAIENYVANARYRFVAQEGPRLGCVNAENPLMHEYFVVPPKHECNVMKEQELMDTDGMHIFAVNGWVMGDDPLRNFAEGSQVYLRRELIAWGDSVKLRYGKKPSDNKYLWDRMRQYAEETARIFHGVRLDNCHSTPIHVAEYMIDAARKVRPNLYVVAELFTGSEHLDNLFMNRLGINSLIREALSAWDAHEEGRLIYRYGGFPVGSFAQPRVRPLIPNVAHAVLYDQTHDNPCPIEKRSVYDLWPSAALVAMANCAIGSTRGYDQLVPHHIHVVNEQRLYPMWSKDSSSPETVGTFSGITNGKRLINTLHYELAIGGYKEVYVDQLDPEVVSVTRHNPQTHQSVVLVARTAFSKPHDPNHQSFFRPIYIQGLVEEVLFEATLVETSGVFTRNAKIVNGLPNYSLKIKEGFRLADSNYAWERLLDDDTTREISFKNFTPGTVIVFRCSLADRAKSAILEIRRGLGQFGYMMRSYSGNTTFDDTWETSNFRAIVSRLTLGDLNRVQYRVDQEEADDKFGFSTYHIPNHGNLCYSGLRGVMSVLGELRPRNDLGHPLCNNLREGDWLPDYIANRLKVVGNTYNLALWFENMFSYLKQIPRFLIPCYFDAIVSGAYIVIREMALQQFSEFVRDGSTFVQALSLGSIQFCGFVRSAKLPPLSKSLNPKYRTELVMSTKEEEEAPISLAAGLPHFAFGIMRNWGRDTFIALRGMLIITGRYQDARMLILAYASTLRHGLIPNLLNEGAKARYNCRDAVWWWLQAIQEYCRMAPNGEDILKDKVSRLFPTDDSPPLKCGEIEQPLCDVIQEALARHATGVKFRERGAGRELDEHMSDEGFNIEIGIRWPEGFVFGGNMHNCGTWMDKMGSSVKAGNKGKPATPRDGSAVELVGLCASTVRWLAEMNHKGVYPYKGVTRVQSDYTDKMITYEEWHMAIVKNFEKNFYISPEPDPDNELNPELIFRRGIYKDSINSSQSWCNFQLRPNFCVAILVAPELFTLEKAWKALLIAQEVLLGPLGMKTLDPQDWSYNGDYIVSNDSYDPNLAHGFNYHNGPEWVWPVAYFLRSKLLLASKLEKKQPGILKGTADFVDTVLCRHYQELMNSPWKSLPELTNTNGSYCADSCRAQAWSDGCILETLYDLERVETAERPSTVNFTS